MVEQLLCLAQAMLQVVSVQLGNHNFKAMRLDKELTSCAHLLFEHYMDAIFGRQENHRLLGTIQF